MRVLAGSSEGAARRHAGLAERISRRSMARGKTWRNLDRDQELMWDLFTNYLEASRALDVVMRGLSR